MDPYIGSLLLVAFPYAHEGFMPCDGRLLQISQYNALFALLGTQFGGDGHTTFALPKVDGPTEHLHWVIAVNGMWPSRP